MEITLVNLYGWSLIDIDSTDVESLMWFAERLKDTPQRVSGPGRGRVEKKKRVYCDQVDWL